MVVVETPPQVLDLRGNVTREKLPLTATETQLPCCLPSQRGGGVGPRYTVAGPCCLGHTPER